MTAGMLLNVHRSRNFYNFPFKNYLALERETELLCDFVCFRILDLRDKGAGSYWNSRQFYGLR